MFDSKDVNHKGVMIAAYIKEPYATQLYSIALEAMGLYADLTPPDEMHITLAYVGDSDELDDKQPGLKEKILRGLDTVTTKYRNTLRDSGWCGYVQGYLRFFPLDPNSQHPLAFTYDSSCMTYWRDEVIDALKDQLADVDDSHGFIPHITFAYVPQTRPTPDIFFPAIEITVDEICLKWGDEKYTFCLNGETVLPELDATAVRKDLMVIPWAAEAAQPLTVFKDFTGEYRWLLVSSSSFKDRDGEWVTGKALVEDAARGDALTEAFGAMTGYGVLRWWHMGIPYLRVKDEWTSASPGPGIDLGLCDFSAVHETEFGVSLIESGIFVNREVAEAVALHAGELGVSLTFSHPDDQPGKAKQYDDIRKVERSLLPRAYPSNLASTLMVQYKEARMKPNKIAELEALGVSRDTIEVFIVQATEAQRALEAAGITSKEVASPAAVATSKNAAVLSALDGMVAGIVALKDYVTREPDAESVDHNTDSKAKPRFSEVEDKSSPRLSAVGDDEDEEEEDTEDKSSPRLSAVRPRAKRKEVSEDEIRPQAFVDLSGLVTRKEFDEAVASLRQSIVADIKAAVVDAVQGETVTTKSVRNIEDLLRAIVGEIPAGVAAGVPPSGQTSNVIAETHPLHVQTKEAGTPANGSFSDGPFGWLDTRMAAAQPAPPSVVPTAQ